jgi:hypothetical protein
MDYHTSTLLSLIETKTFYDGIYVRCNAPHEIIIDGRFVKPTLQTSGYSTVYHAGVTYALHRLIYETLKGRKITDGMQIDHVNGDKSDNNVLNLRECTREENLYNVESRRKSPLLLENLRTGDKRLYSSKTELFKEKAIKIPRMNEPFFSKVHETYFKATPARGNGYDDTQVKNADGMDTLVSPPKTQPTATPTENVKIKKKSQVSGKTVGFRMNTGTLTEDEQRLVDAFAVSSGFRNICYTNTGEVVLANAPNKLNFNSERALEKRIGLPNNSLTKLNRKNPAPESWIRTTFSLGFDEGLIRKAVGEKFQKAYVDALIGTPI